MRLLDYAASAPWAILPERAPELVAVADRAHQANPQMLEGYRAQALDRAERAGLRGDTAVLYVDGPLFKKANMFVEFSGATSYQMLRRDLQTALDSPKVASILLVIDSPGGEANGADELARAIFEARGRKPITAYVSGMAASAAYWIASAADRIVVSEAAVLGSIGVVLTMTDKSVAEERRGVKTIEFVSSQSPGKRPDPSTEEGRNRLQNMVNDMADVFVRSVAKYRDVTADTVVKRFGGGGVLIGAAAVKAGMADAVGQLEATIAGMRSAGHRLGGTRATAPAPITTPSTPAPAVNAADTAGRIKAILTADMGRLLPTLANMLALETDLDVETCLSVLEAAKRAYDSHQADAMAGTPQLSFLEHKRRAGALMGDGTMTVNGMPVAGSAAIAAAWKAAVDAANGRFATMPTMVVQPAMKA